VKDAPLFPRRVRRNRLYTGLSRRQERYFTWIAIGVVLLYISAWIGALIHVYRQRPAPGIPSEVTADTRVVTPTRQMTSALLDPQPGAPVFITDAMLGFLNPLRGESGEVRFATQTPGSEIVGAPANVRAVLTGPASEAVSSSFTAPDKPGIYKLAVQVDRAMRAIDDLNIITLVPISRKEKGKIGLYYLGSWPFESGGKPRTPTYAPPSGFIEVTRENQNTNVSEHFRLRDFLTKDQLDVWPKYLLLNPKLIDKLELTIQELEAQGVKVEHVQVMSGFRTPRYNHSGGNTAGRANLSRHMYGDAADVFVDNDRNGNMDDINGDGRIDTRDADFMGQAVERVERKYPALVGGIGVYSACCGHGPFTHVDVRGHRARWRGSGNG
jgi:uncharacterized protein YcbK (DUF882 family)